MEKETDVKKTLGQAIDEIIRALQHLDQNSRITAIHAACEHLSLPLTGKTIEESAISEPPDLGGGKPILMDIKSLKEQKKPSSANEMAAVVAFYLSELVPVQERKTEVEIDDMVKFFKQATFPLPRIPKVLLQNAKNAGYFDFIGSGKYKLNPVGYNLVAHNLPRSQSNITTKHRKSKKQPKKVKSVKKSK